MGEKLIRDGYVRDPNMHGERLRLVDSTNEHDDFLFNKHIEEVNEFLDAVDGGNKEEIAEEAGDVTETIFARTALHNVHLPQFVEIIPARTDDRELKESLEKSLNFLNQAINNGIEDDIIFAGFSAIETIFAYADLHGASIESVSNAMIEKRHAKGSFDIGVVLIEAD